jgi:hypothetical protein
VRRQRGEWEARQAEKEEMALTAKPGEEKEEESDDEVLPSMTMLPFADISEHVFKTVLSFFKTIEIRF